MRSGHSHLEHAFCLHKSNTSEGVTCGLHEMAETGEYIADNSNADWLSMTIILAHLYPTYPHRPFHRIWRKRVGIAERIEKCDILRIETTLSDSF